MSDQAKAPVPRNVPEYEESRRLANKILDRPSGDPDDDLAMLSRQLLRADERSAALNAELDKGDSWAWIRKKFAKCRTQFKWYTPREDSLRETRYEVMGWLHVLFAHADPKVYIDIALEHQKKADDAAAALTLLESKLAEAERRERGMRDALEAMLSDVNRSDYHTRRTAFDKARAALAQERGEDVPK